MYVRIENPWFLEQDNNGLPAAGYRVYTLVAGSVSTLVTTYSDRALTVPNTNPVVLNTYGEANIFTSGAVKLVYTSPTGDLTSPIWTQDYVGEQQGVLVDKGDGVWIGDNNYTVDIVPAYTSIPDGLSLVVMPDTTCLGTLVIPPGAVVPTVFTGTGINDGIFSGRYTGLTAGAIFAVEIDTLYVSEPVDAPVAAVSVTVAATPPTAGVHLVAVTFVTAEGETMIGPSDPVTADGVHEIALTSVPVGTAGYGVTSRKVYMTEAAGATFYYVDEIPDNTTTTYGIDITDAALALNAAAPASNTTGGGTGQDTFQWQIDAGAVTAGVPITAAAQSLQDGIYITFANTTGHTIGDVWTVEVMTPVRLNFCGLGNDLVYKSSGGSLVVLDAADIIDGYPIHIDRSDSQSCWILLNPSLPVLEALIPLRTRKEVRTNYTVSPTADHGMEINAAGTVTLTMPDCPNAVSRFFYLRNGGTGLVTVDAGTYLIKNFNYPSGSTTYTLNPGQCMQISTNGVDWHIMTEVVGLAPAGIQVAANSASVTFAGLRPGVRYRCLAQLQSLTAGSVYWIRFNGIATGNLYLYDYFYLSPAAGGGASPAAGNQIIPIGGTLTIAYELSLEFEFITENGDPTDVIVMGKAACYSDLGAGSVSCLSMFKGQFAGATDLTSMTILRAANNFTGTVYLYQYL